MLVGRAGTGKTYTLGVAREAWEAQGIPVIGCALAARAALELETGSGIRSATIARLLGDLDASGDGLPPGGVLVIDEAAMVGTRTLARLLDEADRSSTKVVLVGDHHQLPEIDAGGAFRGLTHRLPAIELVENHRQRDVWQRDALDALRDGDPTGAVTTYDDHGALVVGRTADETREQLVGDWWQAVAEHGTEAVMVAASLRDIDDLNCRARILLDEAGELTGRPLEAAGREYRVGDRILCLRNHPRLGVLNGTRGTVTEVDRGARVLTFVRDDTRRAGGPPGRLPRRGLGGPRLRADGTQGPGPHLRRHVRPRLRRDLPRVGVRRALPWPADQPALPRRRAGDRRAGRPHAPRGARARRPHPGRGAGRPSEAQPPTGARPRPRRPGAGRSGSERPAGESRPTRSR